MRFDFTHYGGLKEDDVRDLEQRVNSRILSNHIVNTKVTSVEEAMAQGAMALFGEKYGDQVRMVTIGHFSKELCGGTHVGTTGEVGAFLVAKESIQQLESEESKQLPETVRLIISNKNAN